MRYLIVLLLVSSALAQTQTVICNQVGQSVMCDNGVTASSVGGSVVITSPAPAPALDTSFIAHPAAPQVLAPVMFFPVQARTKAFKPHFSKEYKAFLKCSNKARSFEERVKCKR